MGGIWEDIELAFMSSRSAGLPFPVKVNHTTRMNRLSARFDKLRGIEVGGNLRELSETLQEPPRNPVSYMALCVEKGRGRNPSAIGRQNLDISVEVLRPEIRRES